jgi:hypothetical protein
MITTIVLKITVFYWPDDSSPHKTAPDSGIVLILHKEAESIYILQDGLLWYEDIQFLS